MAALSPDPGRQRLLIAGAGGHARVVAETAGLAGWDVAGWMGPGNGDAVMEGIRRLGSDEDLARVWHEEAIDALIVAIGDNAMRLDTAARFRRAADRPPLIQLHRR